MSDIKKTIYVTVDLETTGLSLLRHGIIQIGALATDENGGTLGYFVEDANPLQDEMGNSTDLTFEQQALDVNGYDLDRIVAADLLPNVLSRFEAFLMRLRDGVDLKRNPPIEGYVVNPADQARIVLVFHSAKFDLPRLEIAYERAGLRASPFFRRVLCTVSLGFAKHGRVLGLKDLLALHGIPSGMAHDALGDAMATSKLFHKLIAKDTTGAVTATIGGSTCPIQLIDWGKAVDWSKVYPQPDPNTFLTGKPYIIGDLMPLNVDWTGWKPLTSPGTTC